MKGTPYYEKHVHKGQFTYVTKGCKNNELGFLMVMVGNPKPRLRQI